MAKLKLSEITVDVEYKDIKNIYLSVYPPNGRVRVTAPRRFELETLRLFVISRVPWIRRQRAKLAEQKREARRDYLTRESHFYLGKRYLLRVKEAPRPNVVLGHKTITLHTRPHSSQKHREAALNDFYRERLKSLVPPMIEKWEQRLGVELAGYGVKKMKTKWGSCNREAKRIWLNLELAKKSLQCIEYVVVHEMVHLLQDKHGDPFASKMDEVLPTWRAHKRELNQAPLSHQEWKYEGVASG